MKRFFIMLFSTLLIFSAVSNAKEKTLSKEWEKEYKSQLKKLKKEGWDIYGSTRSLKSALLSHFEKRCELRDKPGESGSEVMGVASVSDSRSETLLWQKAITNAYSTFASNFVEHVAMDIFEDMLQKDGKEIDDFRATYTSEVEKEIKGELQPSFAIIKKANENQTDMRVFYIVDKNAALKACLHAIDNVTGKSGFIQKNEQQILDIIKRAIEGI